MYCKNCGAKLDEEDIFCYFCGTKTKISTETVEKDTHHESTSIDTEDLVHVYIGPNGNKIIEKKFSFATFFLGPIYLLYRKMGLAAFIWIVVNVFAQILIPKYMLIFFILFSLVFAASFNWLYLQTIKNRIEKIKNKNQEKTSDEIVNIVKKKGGTNIVLTIIMIFLFIILFLVAGFFFFIYNISIGLIEDVKKENLKSDVVGEDLEYKIPDQFESGSITEFYRRYSYYGRDSYCSLKIQNTKSKYYDSIEDYLNRNIYIKTTDEVLKEEEEVINGSIWLHQIIKTSYSEKHYYASENNEKMFLIEFDINRDDDSFCSRSHQTFINSLEFKDYSFNTNDL